MLSADEVLKNLGKLNDDSKVRQMAAGQSKIVARQIRPKTIKAQLHYVRYGDWPSVADTFLVAKLVVRSAVNPQLYREIKVKHLYYFSFNLFWWQWAEKRWKPNVIFDFRLIFRWQNGYYVDKYLKEYSWTRDFFAYNMKKPLHAISSTELLPSLSDHCVKCCAWTCSGADIILCVVCA